MSAAIIAIGGQRLHPAPSFDGASAARKDAMVQLGSLLKQSGYRFTSVTPLTHKRVNARFGAAWAHDLTGMFGWSRPFNPATPGPEIMALMCAAQIIDDSSGMARAAVRASTLGVEAIRRLAPGGRLLLYTGVAMVANADPFRAAVEPRLRAAGMDWTYEEIDPDVFGEELDEPAYAGTERIAAVWLQATRPGVAA